MRSVIMCSRCARFFIFLFSLVILVGLSRARKITQTFKFVTCSYRTTAFSTLTIIYSIQTTLYTEVQATWFDVCCLLRDFRWMLLHQIDQIRVFWGTKRRFLRRSLTVSNIFPDPHNLVVLGKAEIEQGASSYLLLWTLCMREMHHSSFTIRMGLLLVLYKSCNSRV